MKRGTDIYTARQKRLDAVKPVSCENIPLWDCHGRIIGDDITANFNVPPFDRSPYDGYALISADTENATENSPVTLKITEEIRAGGVAHCELKNGECTKILTGAPVPVGCDCVIPFEQTEFTDKEIKIFRPVKKGSNIVLTGEDVQKGAVIVRKGTKADAGVMGSLASQNVTTPLVYKKPVVGIISTGNELMPVGSELQPGKIINSNVFTLSRAVRETGALVKDYGISGDEPHFISEMIKKAVSECDAVIMTGGVSVGDYDYTQQAMEMAGAEILFNGVSMKPGMACVYSVIDGKIVMGLSGNPASSLTNFYAVGLPAIKKLCGYKKCVMDEFDVILEDDFPKKSPSTRLLRGKFEIKEGKACIKIPRAQGNVVISSAVGCDMIAVVPAGSGKLSAGTVLKGFMI